MDEVSKKKQSRLKNAWHHVKKIAKFSANKLSILFKKPAARIALLVVVVVLVGYGIFVIGDRRGAKRQAAIDAQKYTTASQLANRSKNPSLTLPKSQGSLMLVGSVKKVSDKSIDIKVQSGATTTLVINPSTIIIGIDGQKTDTKALKKNQNVVINGAIKSDGAMTATRIRIQK